MNLTFYWHDYETFGVNPAYDRPCQFAGLRTDAELNIIDDPLVIYCKPSIDILPSPEASLITGITPQVADRKGLIEAEFAQRIHSQLSFGGTCGVGYNSLRFDDEVTRNLLYRNFYDPYAREWKNNCSRWDIIDLVRMTYALRPDGMNWPKNEEGKPSFRLEHLSSANGIDHASAHDALSDVYATIELAKTVKKSQPKLFDWLLGLRNKHKVAELIDLRSAKPILHTTRMYSTQNGCTSLVHPLGFESRNKSSLLVYDLRVPPSEFFDLDQQQLYNRLFSPGETLNEGENRLPVKSMKINKCPAIAPVQTLTEEGASRINLNLDLCARNHAQIKQHPEFPDRVVRAYCSRDFEPATDVDGALYQGFFGTEDRKLIDEIRHSTPTELTGAQYQFQDARLDELLFRYRARNWPDSLLPDESDRWQAHCIERYENDDRGLEPYFNTISSLRMQRENDAAGLRILDDLEKWGDSLL